MQRGATAKIRSHKKYGHVYVVIILCFLGMWSDFIASTIWTQLGIVASTALCWVFMRGKLMKDAKLQRREKFKSPLVISLSTGFLALVVYAFLHMATIHGAGTILAYAFGESATRNINVSFNKHESRRGRCPYRATGDDLILAFPGHLCTSRRLYEKGSGMLAITEGKTWYTGYLITNYEFVSPYK